MKNQKKSRERIVTSIGVAIVLSCSWLIFFRPEKISEAYDKLNPISSAFTAFGFAVFLMAGSFMVIKFWTNKSVTDFYGGEQARRQIGNLYKLLFPLAGTCWILAFLLR